MQTCLFKKRKPALYMLTVFSLVWLLCSCSSSGQFETIASDTLIVKQKITDELAGSAYRKRATSYFLVVKGDSSDHRLVFTESQIKGQVSLVLDFGSRLTYEEHLNQLRMLLSEAAQDYNFDSLGTVYVGRLINTGSLAIDITEEYLAVFGDSGSSTTTTYPEIAAFITQSKLGRDIDELFRPYGLYVSGASVEKVFFTPLTKPLAIDTTRDRRTNTPDRLLDAITWISLKKFESQTHYNH